MLNFIDDFWEDVPNVIVGIFEKDNTLYIAAIMRQENRWSIRYWDKTSVIEDNILGYSSFSVAEIVKNICKKNGISIRNVVFCLSRTQIFSYIKSFNFFIDNEKIKNESILWDIDMNVPFEEEEYYPAIMKLNDKGTYLLGAVEKKLADNIKKEFKEAGILLTSLTFDKKKYKLEKNDHFLNFEGIDFSLKESCTLIDGMNVIEEGFLAALFAATTSIRERKINFFSRAGGNEKKLYKQIEIGSVLVLVFLGMSLFLGNCWQIFKVEKSIKQENNRLLNLAGDKTTLTLVKDNKKEVEESNRILEKLTRERISWYATIIEISDASLKKIILDEIGIDDVGIFYMKGTADDINSLNIYIERLRQHDKLYKDGPFLETTEYKLNGKIQFIIKGKL